MLFINISSDKIYLFDGNNLEIIESRSLEQSFPVILKNIYDKKFIDKIYVLNGPGSFTSLRIATLCLNMLNFLFSDKIDLYSISKIDFYKSLVSKGYLSTVGFIFIGQKKNIWKYDFSKDEYEVVTGELGTYNGEYFVDAFNTDEKIENQIAFLSYDKISFRGKEIIIDWNEFDLSPIKSLQPNYMIGPNVTVKSF